MVFSQISQSGHTSQYKYGSDQQRTQQTETRWDGSTRTTQYVNDSYERMVETRANGDSFVQGTHTFFADGQAVTIHVRSTLNGNKNADQFRYLHRDPLNSIDTITDANASVQERLSYGPFGLRRQANGEPLQDLTRNPSALTNRGYTNHEHQDQLILIDMNARMYDPITGRFLSPDTLIPWPTMAMSHNRYTYVRNNPLKYYDPTGHWGACASCDEGDSEDDWGNEDLWDESITEDNGGVDEYIYDGGRDNTSGDVGSGSENTNVNNNWFSETWTSYSNNTYGFGFEGATPSVDFLFDWMGFSDDVPDAIKLSAKFVLQPMNHPEGFNIGFILDFKGGYSVTPAELGEVTIEVDIQKGSIFDRLKSTDSIEATVVKGGAGLILDPSANNDVIGFSLNYGEGFTIGVESNVKSYGLFLYDDN